MQTYRLSATGRRTTLLLLVAGLIIWAFALWSFRSSLNIDYNPLNFVSSLSASIEQGLTISQIVPALLMLVLIVATPLLIWNLIEEWGAGYTPEDDGLRFTAPGGINILYPWDDVAMLRQRNDDSDEPLDELVLHTDHTGSIGNPVIRFLHQQAYGKTIVPIYPGLQQRDELLATIRERVPAVDEAAPTDTQPTATAESAPPSEPAADASS